MKSLIIYLFLSTLSIIGYGQTKKDTVKTYLVNINEVAMFQIDSILRSAYNVTGRALYYEEAEKVKNGLAMLINYFNDEKKKQDLVKPKTKN